MNLRAIWELFPKRIFIHIQGNWCQIDRVIALYWSPQRMGPLFRLVWIIQNMLKALVCGNISPVDFIRILRVDFEFRLVQFRDQVDRKILKRRIPWTKCLRLFFSWSGRLSVQLGSTMWILAEGNVAWAPQTISLNLGNDVAWTLSDLLFRPKLKTRFFKTLSAPGMTCWQSW